MKKMKVLSVMVLLLAVLLGSCVEPKDMQPRHSKEMNSGGRDQTPDRG